MIGKELVRLDPMACFWTDAEDVFDPIRALSSELHGGVPARALTDQGLKVSETKKELRLSLKAPGYDRKHLKVSVRNGRLTISGERREECENKLEGGYSRLSSFGSFTRTLPLPGNVLAGKAKVETKGGEVTVVLPKK